MISIQQFCILNPFILYIWYFNYNISLENYKKPGGFDTFICVCFLLLYLKTYNYVKKILNIYK